VNPKDVVLPTAGIESWVEIHNSPAETETLLQLLPHLKGVDVLTAKFPGQTNRFMVMNSKRRTGHHRVESRKNSFRYSTERGDPLNYLPVVEALSQKNRLDADGFATADDWMAETMTIAILWRWSELSGATPASPSIRRPFSSAWTTIMFTPDGWSKKAASW
jgi:hypothetical protein